MFTAKEFILQIPLPEFLSNKNMKLNFNTMLPE